MSDHSLEARRLIETHAWASRDLLYQAQRSARVIDGLAHDEAYQAETWVGLVKEFVTRDGATERAPSQER